MATWEPVSYYYSGQGVVLLGDRNGTTGNGQNLIPVGNVSDLKIAVSTSVLEHKESTTGARGIDLRLTTEVKAALSMTIENFNAKNLAIALRGTNTTVASGTAVTFNTGVAKEGAILALPHVKVSNVVVKDATDTTTHVAGTDYILNADAGSIQIVEGAGITDLDVLHITYDHAAQEQVGALTVSAVEKFMRFEGLNTADTNAPVVVEVFRFLADPLKELALIGDGIAQFVLEGNILADNIQTGSKYFRQFLIR